MALRSFFEWCKQERNKHNQLKKVVPFVINIAANLYRGDGNIPTSSTEYKMICSVLKKADRLAKPFGKKLNSIGLSSISEAVLPLVNRGADSDRNATVYLENKNG